MLFKDLHIIEIEKYITRYIRKMMVPPHHLSISKNHSYKSAISIFHGYEPVDYQDTLVHC